MLLAWLLTLGALWLFAMVAGHGLTGLFWMGWLINEQHRLSLSRLQQALWTIVVLSAFLTSALFNVRGGHAGTALEIKIQNELWIAMGISFASLVGATLILADKKRRKPDTRGDLQHNDSPQKAHCYDLIRGEENHNAHLLDLTRLQNLFFTLILVGSYAASVGSMMAASGITIFDTQISKLPDLGATAVTLLGISHAGYLANKAVDKQPEGKE